MYGSAVCAPGFSNRRRRRSFRTALKKLEDVMDCIDKDVDLLDRAETVENSQTTSNAFPRVSRSSPTNESGMEEEEDTIDFGGVVRPYPDIYHDDLLVRLCRSKDRSFNSKCFKDQSHLLPATSLLCSSPMDDSRLQEAMHSKLVRLSRNSSGLGMTDSMDSMSSGSMYTSSISSNDFPNFQTKDENEPLILSDDQFFRFYQEASLKPRCFEFDHKFGIPKTMYQHVNSNHCDKSATSKRDGNGGFKYNVHFDSDDYKEMSATKQLCHVKKSDRSSSRSRSTGKRAERNVHSRSQSHVGRKKLDESIRNCVIKSARSPNAQSHDLTDEMIDRLKSEETECPKEENSSEFDKTDFSYAKTVFNLLTRDTPVIRKTETINI